MSKFDTRGAIALYNMDCWGDGYFTINPSGNITVLPTRDPSCQIDLYELVNEARHRGLSLPLVIRFQDLLRDRVETIQRSFILAIEEAGYRNTYRGVFPIKVNQLREVVEEILDAGAPFHVGLEAGSKSELMAALAIHTDPESLVICNGYKDREFIRTALLGRKLGKRVIIVVEKLEELYQVLQLSKEMSVEPYIGMRVRLQSKGAGKWATSGGTNAKFGLSTADLVVACDTLNSVGQSDIFKLLHFHVGSQVPDIGTIKRAIREAARFYSKLQKMGYDLTYLDVGGGLGVDYDGSKTTFNSSTNYTLNEYTRDIVHNIMEVCDSEGVEHPIIVSESGRATVAHHSVLIVEAFGSIEKNARDPVRRVSAEDPKLVEEILEIRDNLSQKNRLESLHNAQQIHERAQAMFDLGLLELRPKAKIETVYWGIASAIVEAFRGIRYVPEEVKEIENILGDQFICNFSVFQSLLDHWALGQLFPVLPIHRLNELPERNGTLVDITCDSDGRVDKFIDLQDVKETLSMHRFRPGEPYFLGFFLVGAYQDIMGGLHNLFGRVNEIHVFMDEDEERGYYIEEILPGSTVGQVLFLTQWDVNELIRRMKTQTDAAIKSDKLKPNEGMRLLNEYEKGFSSYTYLKFENGIF
ncbi:biosynthetic arginine decarboxylase [Candidatus Xiphinematobacter sp. Idaho Grape]|uniref:biosynthetic arginine decarboxylase n=1 Tax=Candidatus Xiphinematobacter sp. Idaho Grape TaxID=1704307 RepID=UPI002A4E1E00|nr:biosynthetic arginine decarboxylase [Candidatus Xiphinematobacter sp. Idaho Grape]